MNLTLTLEARVFSKVLFNIRFKRKINKIVNIKNHIDGSLARDGGTSKEATVM